MSGESDKVRDITRRLSEILSPLGMEIYPFKMGWYNDAVADQDKFDIHADTLVYVIISTPDMFEKALIPFMCREDVSGSMDLLDRCLKHHFFRAKQEFPNEDVEVIHDFELTPARRGKILVQPAGHVAGAAYYYTRKDLNPDPFEESKRIYGISIHPKYGGWFALRGVFIFKSVLCPNLPRREPVDCVPEQNKRAELLELMNFHWQDWRYRDIIPVEKKYSEDQKKYFQTLPKDRLPLVLELKAKCCGVDGSAGKVDSAETKNVQFKDEETPKKDENGTSMTEFY